MKNKIKIIDLLVKITNKEEVPKKIKYRKSIYVYDDQRENYYLENKSMCGLHSLFNELCTSGSLNDEVEIIEEVEKPRKIAELSNLANEKGNTAIGANIWTFYYKLNELTKAVNYLLKKEDEK